MTKFEAGDEVVIHPDPQYIGYDPKHEGVKDVVIQGRVGNRLILTKKFHNGPSWFEHELETAQHLASAASDAEDNSHDEEEDD